MIQNGVEMYTLDELQQIRDRFLKELTDSASGRKTSLLFIPNTIPQRPIIAENEEFQVISIGGSHMKKARMINVRGTIEIYNKTEEKVPIFKDKDIFFAFIDRHIDHSIKHLAINFAQAIQPVIRGSKLDGILIHASKEHSFDGLLEKIIGEQIERHIKSKYNKDIVVAVANDIVCLVLSGLQMTRYEVIIGGIVGTGVNFGFFLDSNTIINIESGNFDKFEQTSTGKTVDKDSNKPGEFIFEKETAGRYIVQHYNTLLEGTHCATTEALSQVAQGEGREAYVAQKLFERSASLIATQMAGLYHYKKQKNLVCAMEGSLFWKGWNYSNMVRDYLQKLGVPAGNMQFVDIEDNSLFGPARLLI
ncbi:hypothetical protein A3H80_01610 [Candidatus Roizmanbacteria bacterium RIFCSPLOWO2_02_FULL_37_19]|uniref:Hexokinase C-terminal domain-containing protein n=1 Tax=Candidatus Roizmanbacteria bacterium RIFCSPHIGHO2_02_FULL_37_24 TaxID=1802037 RepID=A0A1F7H188_9BACT|nr:MAG: hypothetical protein A2862_04505 [Candidatus Roizmanbacteria bacterium RIFCSPHIGHO2_01_FULL_38_41]OGK24616.1 MAG: hypothetical protein A3C24_02390 [Candidatus Roizmanbacteria bacterium RIFCSPHIGHO2_02_FULL_37_24]OGK32254.1 MAG: hypothetical protein A3E10_02330 [Candidatus Roizmanbacteria bacterium RIFCSPHIGHO2_12_FULL_37_23]OGK45548.1 MAG: hypothetical protein A2956_03100 [Candidatus Roizmanbacteria bacterium RIFCSPLOWO2_01_FULL_37_57]OGK53887.1 MAG: hypothetical protein A3H80_01610 [Ca